VQPPLLLRLVPSVECNSPSSGPLALKKVWRGTEDDIQNSFSRGLIQYQKREEFPKLRHDRALKEKHRNLSPYSEEWRTAMA